MASTDVISIGVVTRSRKRARETALHLLPALQDPRDRKKFKAESPPELSQILPTITITRTPTPGNKESSRCTGNTHGHSLYQNSTPPPPPISDDKRSTNSIPSRSPCEVIDLTVDRQSSTVEKDINRFTVLLSPNTRLTRSAARRAQLQAKLAQESTRQSGHPGDDVSISQPNTQLDPSLSTTPAPISATTSKETENALGNSASTTDLSDAPQPSASQMEDNNITCSEEEESVIISAMSQMTQQKSPIPITEDTAETTTPVALDSFLTEAGAAKAFQHQQSALSGTLEYISPQCVSGEEVFPSCNPSPSDVINTNTSGSDDHPPSKKLVLPKTFPSSYLAPNPVRRAPRISTAKRDTTRYLLEATEKAALLAYRETKRQFPQWMSNPSRTFFKDSTYIPRGLPIRYSGDNNARMQLNATRTDLGMMTTSNFISSDAFTLPSLPAGGLSGAFQSSIHIQLDPDLDPSPLSMRTSASLEPASSLSPPPSFTSDLNSTSTSTSTTPLRITKKGLWYNYALSVQHACHQSSSPISCGFTENDDTFSMSLGNDFPIPSSTANEEEGMYDAGKDGLDWAAPVPPYYPLTEDHMGSTSLSLSSVVPSGDSSSLGAMNSSYFGTDLIPSLEQSSMTTSGSLLTEWNMDGITQPQRGSNGTSFPKSFI